MLLFINKRRFPRHMIGSKCRRRDKFSYVTVALSGSEF